MKLNELLAIIKHDEIEIRDKSGKGLVYSQNYSEVRPYLYMQVLNITTNGYGKLFTTIDYEEKENKNGKKS